MKIAVVIVAVGAAFAFAPTVHANAKATFDEVCSECHEPDDHADRTPADLEKTIKGIVAGTVKHKKKKLTLTDAEAAEMAKFLAAGGK
jgi:mono/diheme cytochrome c family protein